MRQIKLGTIYKHFKGHLYKVLNIGKDSETLEDVVVYENIDTKEVWVRPLEMFNSLVDKEKYPNIEQTYRFEETNEF